jgi:uncharacterized protein YecE (DUF72 family)
VITPTIVSPTAGPGGPDQGTGAGRSRTRPDPDHLYAGSYSDADLGWWADRIREWNSQGREAYAYVNNDGEGHAVRRLG